MIYVLDGAGGEFLHEGEPLYPVYADSEILVALPRAGLPRLIADPACPDVVRTKALTWLARHGVTVKVERAA